MTDHAQIRADFTAQIEAMRIHIPFGVALREDREGVLRRVAREHGLTIEAAREIIEEKTK